MIILFISSHSLFVLFLLNLFLCKTKSDNQCPNNTDDIIVKFIYYLIIWASEGSRNLVPRVEVLCTNRCATLANKRIWYLVVSIHDPKSKNVYGHSALSIAVFRITVNFFTFCVPPRFRTQTKRVGAAYATVTPETHMI